jgi:hypothetical protein
MAVLVFGAGGWIGGLLREPVESRGLEYRAASCRADCAAAVRAELRAARPRLVFACVGRTHGPGHNSVDYLEQPGKLPENLRDNLVAPLVLAHECQRAGVPFACLATGCIFEGGAHEAFAEDAAPNFHGSAYSCVQAAKDQLLAALFADSALWFRIRMPITHDLHPRSFLTKITRYERVCSAPNSMSVLDGAAGLLHLFVAMALAGYRGAYNGCNPGVLSHNEVLALYRDVVDPAFTWQNFSAQEQAQVLAAGRSNNRLCALRLQQAAAELGLPLPSLREALLGVMRSLRGPERAKLAGL